MSGIFEKTFESLGTMFASVPSIGIQTLLEKCFSARTKQEEKKLVQESLQIVKQKLSDPSTKPLTTRSCLALVIYCEMLGYKAEFAYIHAIKLAQSSNFKYKRIGYLACSFLLNETHELAVLFVNTILQDLQSRHLLVIGIALAATCCLIPLEVAPAVLPLVQKKLDHPNEYVRSKAVIVMHYFLRKCSEQSLHYMPQVRSHLSDRNPAVVAQVLHYLEDVAQLNPSALSNLVPALIHIEKQIVERNLPEEYNYHKAPAPWMQLNILRLFRYLYKADPTVKSVIPLVQEVLKSAETCNYVGYAIIYESIVTLVTLDASEDHLSLLMNYTRHFLLSKSNNLKYTGLILLEVILQRYPVQIASEQQDIILSGLDHPDESIKRKTLTLLCCMANPQNIEVICGKIYDYIQVCHNEYFQKDLLTRVLDLMEKLPVRFDWYMMMLLRLLPVADLSQSKIIQNKIKSSLSKCGCDGTADSSSRIIKMIQILRKFSGTKTVPTSILELYVWVTSRFFSLEKDRSAEDIITDLIELGRKVMKNNKDMPTVICELMVSIIIALSVIAEKSCSVPCCLKEFLLETLATKNIYIMDKSNEVLRMLDFVDSLRCSLRENQDIDRLDFTLSFLDGYVAKSLEGSGRPYVPLVGGLALSLSASSSSAKASGHQLQLNLQPYGQLLESPSRSSSHGSIGFHSESVSSGDSFSWSLRSEIGLSRPVPKLWSKDGRAKEHLSEFVKQSSSESAAEGEKPLDETLASALFGRSEEQSDQSSSTQDSFLITDPLGKLLEEDISKFSKESRR